MFYVGLYLILAFVLFIFFLIHERVTRPYAEVAVGDLLMMLLYSLAPVVNLLILLDIVWKEISKINFLDIVIFKAKKMPRRITDE
jgi:hypothetical protein